MRRKRGEDISLLSVLKRANLAEKAETGGYSLLSFLRQKRRQRKVRSSRDSLLVFIHPELGKREK